MSPAYYSTTRVASALVLCGWGLGEHEAAGILSGPRMMELSLLPFETCFANFLK